MGTYRIVWLAEDKPHPIWIEVNDPLLMRQTVSAVNLYENLTLARVDLNGETIEKGEAYGWYTD